MLLNKLIPFRQSWTLFRFVCVKSTEKKKKKQTIEITAALYHNNEIDISHIEALEVDIHQTFEV